MVICEEVTLTVEHFNDAKKVAYALLDKLDDTIVYHRKEHTTDYVVPAAQLISDQEKVSLEEKLLSGIAAAFHDTGFTQQYIANEPIGAKLAEEYMKSCELGYTKRHVEIVKGAINNTNMKTPPSNMVEKIVRDADLSILGSPDLLSWQNDLKVESSKYPACPLYQASLSDQTWGPTQLGFLANFHHWHTEGARQLYDEEKQRNILRIKEMYDLN